MTTFGIACIDTKFHDDAWYAISKTLSCFETLNLQVRSVYWLSDKTYDIGCSVPVVHYPIPIFEGTTNDYGHTMMRIIPKLLVEDRLLVVQHDGYAVNSAAWTDAFLEYDYIGAVWPHWCSPNHIRVGNGGFSLRSKRLMDTLLNFPAPSAEYKIEEDVLICNQYRDMLENDYQIKFAPEEIAHQFSIEHCMDNPWLGKSFGFHGTHGIKDYYDKRS